MLRVVEKVEDRDMRPSVAGGFWLRLLALIATLAASAQDVRWLLVPAVMGSVLAAQLLLTAVCTSRLRRESALEHSWLD